MHLHLARHFYRAKPAARPEGLFLLAPHLHLPASHLQTFLQAPLDLFLTMLSTTLCSLRAALDLQGKQQEEHRLMYLEQQSAKTVCCEQVAQVMAVMDRAVYVWVYEHCYFGVLASADLHSCLDFCYLDFLSRCYLDQLLLTLAP